MTPENITETTLTTPLTAEQVATPTGGSTPETSSETPHTGEKKFSRDRRNDRGGRRDRNDKKDKPKKEFDELLLEVRRVTRVTTGGRRMSFRATILVGNKKGKIGLGVSKGNDVAGAVSKATNEAYKAMFQVPITKGDTVPYALTYKYKSANVRLLPASAGTGLKAGSSIRSVLELAGYSNILSKMIGSNNKLNNALATIKALASYKHADYFSGLREVVETAPQKEEKAETTTETTSPSATSAPSSEKGIAPTPEKKAEKKPAPSSDKKTIPTDTAKKPPKETKSPTTKKPTK